MSHTRALCCGRAGRCGASSTMSANWSHTCTATLPQPRLAAPLAARHWRARSQALTAAAAAAASTARPDDSGVERAVTAKASSAAQTCVTARDSAYTLAMSDAMGWPEEQRYEYSLARGLYFHEVLPGLFCGSQPRHAQDVDTLHALGATTVISMQQDKDLVYWNIDPEPIRQRCAHHGIHLVRRPVQDFDPHSLRKVLPAAVQALHEAYSAGHRVYVHCTAGLGRAPGVLIAYLYWFHDLSLDEAYELLTSIRPCGPKKEAVRGATYDLAHPNHHDGFDRLPQDAYARLGAEERRQLQDRLVQGHFQR